MDIIKKDWQEQLADNRFVNTISKRNLKRMCYSVFHDDDLLARPIIILGCGRSGTTILGELLGQHPQLAYLNEPRDIWRVIPPTDIWSAKAKARNGQLSLSGIHVTSTAKKKLHRLFAAEVLMRKRKRLLEKLPENSFRIGMIQEIFPDAMYVHMIRNGLDVAHSIVRLAVENKWWGANNYKWLALRQYAQDSGYEKEAVLCNDHLSMGLLEWRMSIDAARKSLVTVPGSNKIEIRYEDLLEDPFSICNTLENFASLEYSESVRKFAKSHISRRTKAYDMESLSGGLRVIAGNLFDSLGYCDLNENRPLS